MRMFGAYLVVSRLLPLLAKYAIYRGSKTLKIMWKDFN